MENAFLFDNEKNADVFKESSHDDKHFINLDYQNANIANRSFAIVYLKDALLPRIYLRDAGLKIVHLIPVILVLLS